MNIVKLAKCGAIFGAAMLFFVGVASAQSALNSTSYTGPITIAVTKPPTATPLATLVTIAPASGCPCRAIASYFVPTRSGGTRGGVDAWVSDNVESPNFAASTNTFTINTNSQLSASDISLGSYSNGEAVTFTLNIQAQFPAYKAENASSMSGVVNYFKVFFTPDITPLT